MNAADTTPKESSGPVHERHWSFFQGVRFHQPSSSSHGKYIRTYNVAIATILINKT